MIGRSDRAPHSHNVAAIFDSCNCKCWIASEGVVKGISMSASPRAHSCARIVYLYSVCGRTAAPSSSWRRNTITNGVRTEHETYFPVLFVLEDEVPPCSMGSRALHRPPVLSPPCTHVGFLSSVGVKRLRRLKSSRRLGATLTLKKPELRYVEKRALPRIAVSWNRRSRRFLREGRERQQ